ncbi:nodulin homeobox isoform X2 [Brachypodium distachyon]|uniref:nodulin homeobox isoform X2 n=1 Tax=Brachypodium distachyon TaxID=15368 RepID=UPI00052FFCB1|nr:nodulin homeobox isoform X2 [Brachypodium distachyon]|eukprot:XP_003578513.2 nodulin homeobox isoform X2 [Brachypodium distachyon]
MMIDMVSAIEELSGLPSRELSEMLKESESFVLQYKAEDGGPKQVDMEKLVSSLPLHLLAVCLELGRDSDLTYVLRGIRFLHSLSELATRYTRLEQLLLDDVKLSEQVMDLILFVLTILAHQKKENHLGASPFIHSSLVAASLHLLTSYFSSQCHELVHILLAHSKVDIFMDVAFESLHEDMKLLSLRLSTLGTDAFPVGPFDSQLTHFICQQCEASLQFLLLLCQQKLFRDRIFKNKELCRKGGILSLSLTILKLGVPECLQGSTHIVSSISRLKAKVLSIVLQLCEAESISYLDEVATLPKSMQLGQTLALEVLDLLKTAFGRKEKPAAGSHDKSFPMGSVLISALRLVDVFSDDSNFRSSFITNTIPFLTQILATPHDEFSSSWCSVNMPVIEEDANLEYDPFGAAELALVAASDIDMLTEAKANYSCPLRTISVSTITYAQTRTSYVVKIIANLHVFVPNICEEQERDLFLQKFQKYLLSESPRPSLDHPASDEATTVCRNLESLSRYAKSLIPNHLLNEEDVQLLSEFAYKLQKWCESLAGLRTLQVAKSETSLQIKEDLQKVIHHLTGRLTTVPNSNMNNPLKDAQNMEESTPTPSMKQEGNARDETPRKRASINCGLLQNSVGQNLIHLGVARTTKTGYPGVSTATSTVLQHCRSVDHFKTPEPTTESGLQDDDERQRKRKKRTIMNDGQVNEIENALNDEPEMHKNATSLQAWAEKLSGQGSEITSSQLKNWLNNRKAKLARVAKERGVPCEGDNADKPSTPATSHFGDSSESAGEESYFPPPRVMNALGISKGNGQLNQGTNDTTTQAESNQNIMMSCPFTKSYSFELGRPVLLIDNQGNEIGRGEIFQVEGMAQGKSLTESHICIINITDLKIEKWRELPHPSEASGRTFQEAESRHGGVMRVAWDVIRLAPVVP